MAKELPREIAIEILEHRIADIGRRLSEIEPEVSRLPPPIGDRAPQLSDRQRELAAEFSGLHGSLRDAETTLERLRSPPPASDPRHRKMVDAMVAEQSETMLAGAARFAEQGDHRNARLHRMELLNLRERIERELMP